MYFRRKKRIFIIIALMLSVSVVLYAMSMNSPLGGILPTTPNASHPTQQALTNARGTSISIIPGKPTVAPTPTPTATATATAQPTQGSSPIASGPPANFSGLHVQGNNLLNAQGQVVHLHGVNRSGTEYSCIHGEGFFDGPGDEASVRAIASWNINAVRVPMNEDCWLNINGAPAAYAGDTYKQMLINFVGLLTQYHIYPILELHWSAPGGAEAQGQAAMPDRDHSIEFWKEVAATFQTNTTVLFDPFNEPFPDGVGDDQNSWQCWRDGSTSDPASCSGTTFNGASYQIAGMQDLVSAIRASGAQNVIVLSGIQYANDVASWLEFKPQDPLNNLAAAWHVYPVGQICHELTCYNNTAAPVAGQVPLIATEFGEGVDGACGVTNSNILLDWLEAHNASYVAWTWDTWGSDCADLSLILDYNGTPKDPNGTNYKARLAKFG